MPDETIKQIKNADANTIQLTDYVNNDSNDYLLILTVILKFTTIKLKIIGDTI